MLQGLTVYAHTVEALLSLMNYIRYMSAQFFSHLGYDMPLCLPQTLTL